MANGYDIARDYARGNLSGWMETRAPGIAGAEFSRLSGNFISPRIVGRVKEPPRKMFLFQLVRKVLGRDIENIPQEIGDCFIGGTMVRMADGSEKPIQNIVIGDTVMSPQGNARKVTATIKKLYKGKLVTLWGQGCAQGVTGTPDHRIMAPRSDSTGDWWVTMDNYDLFYRVLIPFSAKNRLTRDKDTETVHHGFSTPVTAIQKYENDTHVYCLEVEHDHAFIANGYAVSNCVSWGARNATEYLTCVQIALKNPRQKYRPVFAPYYYGTGRVYVGHGQIGNEDGSLGSWMAEAVMKYGTLFSDDSGVPPYSGRVAKAWGDPDPAPDLDKFKSVGQERLVKSAAQIRSWDELVDAIANGYPCTIASNQGFQMEPGRDGFHAPEGTWGHQMSWVGYGLDPEPYVLQRNSWGPVHGVLKDFDSDLVLPDGYMRIRRKVAERMIAQEECFAYSNFEAMLGQEIPEDLFLLV